nr:MAG TPA: hypothetical protein [Caudoviricetes sp.]
MLGIIFSKRRSRLFNIIYKITYTTGSKWR